MLLPFTAGLYFYRTCDWHRDHLLHFLKVQAGPLDVVDARRPTPLPRRNAFLARRCRRARAEAAAWTGPPPRAVRAAVVARRHQAGQFTK